jgi:multidrug resistance efflux pump
VPTKRTYKYSGTKDFLVLSLIFFFLCLWAVKDAWYPSEKVVNKHPQLIEASFETGGTLGKLHVAEGDSIGEEQLLAELGRVKMKMQFDVAKKEYTEAKNKTNLMQEALRNAEGNGASENGVAEIQKEVGQARAAMEEALAGVSKVRAAMDASELRSTTKGEIKEIRVVVHGQVAAGETVLVIDPKDHFYLFNKSLAIFSFIAFWVFLGLHILAH